MEDQSELDKKYFIDEQTYNCPYCNRRNVIYAIVDRFRFDWSKEKVCYGYVALCSSCSKESLHLSYDSILDTSNSFWFHERNTWRFKAGLDLDSLVFYSQPTSFFTVDRRIRRILRELISEAEGCLKMNYLTGASACMRKAVYELLVLEKAEGDDYESRIKSLKKKYPESDPRYFDILSHIQDMTSDKVHEQSWDKWDSSKLGLIIGTLKNVLYDIYVLPAMKEERSLEIQRLQDSMKKDKKKQQGSSG